MKTPGVLLLIFIFALSACGSDTQSPEVTEATLENESTGESVVEGAANTNAEAENTSDNTPAAQIDSQTPEPTQAEPEQLKIMPTGDSITHGTLGQRSYRYPLGNMLAGGGGGGCDFEMVGSQLENEDPTSFRSGHEGYSHHRAQHFLNGFNSDSGDNTGILDSMNRFNPEVVLLHIGSNDVAQGESIASTVNEIEEIISIVFSVNPDAVLFVANVIPWYGSTNANSDVTEDITALGQAIDELVNQLDNPNVQFVDVQSGYTQDMMLADLVHPNNDGELHIARAFDDAIDASGVCFR